MQLTSEFPDVRTIAGKTTLSVDSKNLNRCLEYYRDNSIDFLEVNPMRGFTGKNLDFLTDYPFVRGLTIVSPVSGDFPLDPVLSLRDLRELTVSAPLLLPLGELPRLEVVRGVWHSKLDLTKCETLRVLDLSGYKPKSKDLTELPSTLNIRELILVQPAISSLQGISRLQRIESVDLAYASKLRTLSELELLPSLQTLHCQKCSKLDDILEVSNLKNLRSLRLTDCGSIPSLGFLERMPHLEEFRFVNTNVLDGDLSPLLRLKWVGFLPKRHYSHTPQQIDDVLRLRGGGAIARIE